MYDYLIVGQGIAGTSLAHILLQYNKKILIINDDAIPSSSKVAAGIFNPLTGKKLVKTWMADELFPCASEFYQEMERVLSTSFYHPLGIYRPFRSLSEQNDYLALAADPAIAKYIETDPEFSAYDTHISNPYGGLEVKGSGWIDVPSFLTQSRAYFKEKEMFLERAFSEADLLFENGMVKWKDLTFKSVILCQGIFARDNSFFDWLPFNPVKGQILELRMDHYGIRTIVNQGVFLLPQKGGLVKAGATYSWHDLDWEVTADGRKYLTDKLQPLLKDQYEIVSQKAGIRPSVKDRRPLIGMHPSYPALGVFNGFGSKGVTLIPYFARQFADYLERNKELDPFVNIKRYFSLSYQSNF